MIHAYCNATGSDRPPVSLYAFNRPMCLKKTLHNAQVWL